jgi:hypothetical protein
MMKKLILLTLLNMCITQLVMGQQTGKQTDIGTLVYDFDTKKFDDIDILPVFNKPYRVKIIHLDRLSYNIHMAYDDIEFGSEEPELWKKYFGLVGLTKSVSTTNSGNKGLLPKGEDQFTYISPPIYPKGSLLNVGIRIFPNDSSIARAGTTGIPLTDDSLNIELRVRHKWNVSFSTGPFGVFKNAKTPESYQMQQQADSTGLVGDSAYYKRVSTGNVSPPIGISAFANIGVMLANNFGLGASIGVGVAISEDPKPVYMLGGTMMIGHKRQFCVSFGLSLMEVSILNQDLYPEDRKYESAPELTYSNVLTPGGFVSLTYTLYTLTNKRSASSKSK